MPNFAAVVTIIFTLIIESDCIRSELSRFLAKVWGNVGTSILIDAPVALAWNDIRGHLNHCENQGFGNFLQSLPNDVKNRHEVYVEGYSRSTPTLSQSDSENIILDVTRNWTRNVISDFSVCPFTIDEKEAGIPKGKIRYTVSSAASVEESFHDFWLEISALLESNSHDIATILLVYGKNELFVRDIELFELFTACLDDTLKHAALDMEKEVQLVYFHPNFKFRDKSRKHFNC